MEFTLDSILLSTHWNPLLLQYILSFENLKEKEEVWKGAEQGQHALQVQ